MGSERGSKIPSNLRTVTSTFQGASRAVVKNWMAAPARSLQRVASASTLLPAFNVASEVIEDRLPTTPLLFDGMGRFRVKDNPHIDAA